MRFFGGPTRRFFVVPLVYVLVVAGRAVFRVLVAVGRVVVVALRIVLTGRSGDFVAAMDRRLPMRFFGGPTRRFFVVPLVYVLVVAGRAVFRVLVAVGRVVVRVAVVALRIVLTGRSGDFVAAMDRRLPMRFFGGPTRRFFVVPLVRVLVVVGRAVFRVLVAAGRDVVRVAVVVLRIVFFAGLAGRSGVFAAVSRWLLVRALSIAMAECCSDSSRNSSISRAVSGRHAPRERRCSVRNSIFVRLRCLT